MLGTYNFFFKKKTFQNGFQCACSAPPLSSLIVKIILTVSSVPIVSFTPPRHSFRHCCLWVSIHNLSWCSISPLYFTHLCPSLPRPDSGPSISPHLLTPLPWPHHPPLNSPDFPQPRNRNTLLHLSPYAGKEGDTRPWKILKTGQIIILVHKMKILMLLRPGSRTSAPQTWKKWLKAADAKIFSLIGMKTWKLVPHTQKRKRIPSNRVFVAEWWVGNTILKLKAFLVAMVSSVWVHEFTFLIYNLKPPPR